MTVEVVIMEYERGWGSRIDEVRQFPDTESAEAFVKEFNSYNILPEAPDWYMKAYIGKTTGA